MCLSPLVSLEHVHGRITYICQPLFLCLASLSARLVITPLGLPPRVITPTNPGMITSWSDDYSPRRDSNTISPPQADYYHQPQGAYLPPPQGMCSNGFVWAVKNAKNSEGAMKTILSRPSKRAPT